ncbi:MAG: hypothetical protein P4M06_17475 [Pandoraea sp.]|nr:hypothetical protein [Pandoraea sp.]MDR3399337.1 hypothetical protein [Pandoraea sp.]
MIDRIPGASSRPYSPGVSDIGAIAAASPNPLLATMVASHEELRQLQSMADTWLGAERTRMNVAREVSDFAALAGAMARRASTGASKEVLPKALRDFAVQHELVSPQAAAEPFDAASLQSLESRLRSLALTNGASSTRDQIQLKKLVTRYDSTLTLYNAMIARLGEVTKRILSSI